MNYDVIVIGGGPAGLIAAGRAGERGARVFLVDKNKEFGRKLLMTGKGRCNITNVESNIRIFAEKFGRNGKFLYPSLHKFGTGETIRFFHSQGVKTKVERGGRVFPKSDDANDVLSALLRYIEKNRIHQKTNMKVRLIVCENSKIQKIILANGEELRAKKYIICTGGKSYPITGSTGDGYFWLEKMGHTVIAPKPALAPVLVYESWVRELEGLSLKNVSIGIFQDNKKIDSRFGEAIFTANGLSGPIILDMSKQIGEVLAKGEVELRIDFKPALDFSVLDKRVQRDFSEFSNKIFKNSLDDLLPKKIISTMIDLSGIDPLKKVNSITQEERKKLLHLLKEFKLRVKKVDEFTNAIITTGGVPLKEVDPKTMKSKIIENLYLAGEILDLDGPTGGYNLQVCWSTGFVAGESSAV